LSRNDLVEMILMDVEKKMKYNDKKKKKYDFERAEKDLAGVLIF
jgi:hypothetical protein